MRRPNVAIIIVLTAIFLTVSLPPVLASSRSATSGSLWLTGGQSGTVHCSTPGENWNRSGFPLVVHCPPAVGPPTSSTTSTSRPPPSTSSTTVPPPPGNTPASDMPRSLFNQNVTGWGTLPNSAQLAADFVSAYQTHYGSVGVNSMPIFAIPNGTPDSPMSVNGGCNNFRASTGSEVPVPGNIVLNGTADNPLVLYSTSLDRIWEFWQFQRSGNGYSACWGGSAVLSTFSGVFPPYYGLSASGINYLGTTVTEQDIASGAIDHAIAVILPPSNCNGNIYPADRGDCPSNPGQPSEGSWFRFAPGTQMPGGLTPFAQMVFRAILTYGLIVVDQGGAVMIWAEQTSDWAAEGHSGTDPLSASWAGQQEYQVVAALPWANLQALSVPVSAVQQPRPSGEPFYPWPG